MATMTHYLAACAAVLLLAVLPVVYSRDCSDAAAKIGEEAGDFVEACLPEHPGFAGAVAGKLEAALEGEHVTSIALFGTEASGLYRATAMLIKAVGNPGYGKLVRNMSMSAINVAEDPVESLKDGIVDALRVSQGFTDCSRAIVVLSHMEALQSGAAVSKLLAPLDQDRSLMEGLSTTKSLFVLLFDMNTEAAATRPGADTWGTPAWDWREFLDQQWPEELTRGTLTGRLTGAFTLPPLSAEKEQAWRTSIADEPECWTVAERTAMHRRSAIGSADIVKFVGAGAIAVIALVLACQLRCGPATRGAAAETSSSGTQSSADSTQEAQSPGSGTGDSSTRKRKKSKQ